MITLLLPVLSGRNRREDKSIQLTILNPKHVIYEGEAKSVFLPGDLAEFEILDYHAPIVSLLKPGEVVVDWKIKVPIKQGMVKFDNNICTVLVEE